MSKKKKYMGKKYQKLKRYILKEKPDTNPSELDELWIKLSQTKSHGGTRRGSYEKKNKSQVVTIIRDKKPLINIGGEYKDK